QPGVVFRLAEAGLQQLLEHDGDLDPVGRGQRIQLQRMLATRQLTLVGGPGNGPVDAGKLAAVVLVPGPDPGWCVGLVAHRILPFETRPGIGRREHETAYYPLSLNESYRRSNRRATQIPSESRRCTSSLHNCCINNTPAARPAIPLHSQQQCSFQAANSLVSPPPW